MPTLKNSSRLLKINGWKALGTTGGSLQNADKTETEIQAFYAMLLICGFSDDHSRRTADYATQHGRPTAGVYSAKS